MKLEKLCYALKVHLSISEEELETIFEMAEITVKQPHLSEIDEYREIMKKLKDVKKKVVSFEKLEL